MSRRIVLALSGASGAPYAIRALQLLRELGLETHLIVSPAARRTIPQETDLSVEQVLALADVHYDFGAIGAPVASGSFKTDGMLVVPCSIKTLSAIANSYADNLTARAADVTLKEGRPLLLAVRETPLHQGHLELMARCARMGAIIFPPLPSFYGKPRSVDELVTITVGRMLLRLGIDNPAYKPWEGLNGSAA